MYVVLFCIEQFFEWLLLYLKATATTWRVELPEKWLPGTLNTWELLAFSQAMTPQYFEHWGVVWYFYGNLEVNDSPVQ